eukprot:m.1258544 g.1258544  ORF g.1258544 m.1258544 type:complete len:373 (+) comp24719_c0_seq9:219-1337(+)
MSSSSSAARASKHQNSGGGSSAKGGPSVGHSGLNMSTPLVQQTLSRFIMDEFRDEDTGISFILNGISVAAKVIANQVQHAGIKRLRVEPDSSASAITCADRELSKLDEVASDVILNALKFSQKVGLAYLDGHEQPYEFTGDGSAPRKYAVICDPLDGSTNVYYNISAGTIFGIYQSSTGENAKVEDIIQPGSAMVAAGYVLYGSATVMLITKGNGVHSFVMDPDYGEFVMTQKNVRIPEEPLQIYSINSGNSEYWDKATQQFIAWTKAQDTPYSARYIGSMVSDVHRTILCGGIFMYPADKRKPNGKLRLLSECNPLAWLMEQAGGMASTGTQRLLDVVPSNVHERSAIFMGCARDVTKVQEFYAMVGSEYE